MRENLEHALKWVLAHEGGYVNHPKDPGGATNMGVTQRTYNAYRARRGLPAQSVRGITSDEVAEIYKTQYWDAVRADDLPAGLDYAVFDYAVNSGPSRAMKDLQREVGAAPDGINGMRTMEGVNAADTFDLIERLCHRRMRFLRGLKHWPTFGKGWTRRVMGLQDGVQLDDIGVIDRAIKLATHTPPESIAVPAAAAPGKAQEVDRASAAQSSTIQAVGAQIAAIGGAGLAAFQQLDGTAQIVVVALMGAAALSAMWILRERLRHWAEGVR